MAIAAMHRAVQFLLHIQHLRHGQICSVDMTTDNYWNVFMCVSRFRVEAHRECSWQSWLVLYAGIELMALVKRFVHVRFLLCAAVGRSKVILHTVTSCGYSFSKKKEEGRRIWMHMQHCISYGGVLHIMITVMLFGSHLVRFAEMPHVFSRCYCNATFPKLSCVREDVWTIHGHIRHVYLTHVCY